MEEALVRKVVLFALVAMCALLVAPSALAAKGGNSPNAKLCQKGGFEDWVRSDGTAFANVGACVSYAARGGSLRPKPPKSAAQLLCESLDGTYVEAPAAGTLWECNDWPITDEADFHAKAGQLHGVCFVPGATTGVATGNLETLLARYSCLDIP